MDLGLSDNRITSFRLFQQRIITEYEKMIDEFALVAIDGTLPVEVQQNQVRDIVSEQLKNWRGLPNPVSRAVRSQTRRLTREY